MVSTSSAAAVEGDASVPAASPAKSVDQPPVATASRLPTSKLTGELPKRISAPTLMQTDAHDVTALGSLPLLNKKHAKVLRDKAAEGRFKRKDFYAALENEGYGRARSRTIVNALFTEFPEPPSDNEDIDKVPRGYYRWMKKSGFLAEPSKDKCVSGLMEDFGLKEDTATEYALLAKSEYDKESETADAAEESDAAVEPAKTAPKTKASAGTSAAAGKDKPTQEVEASEKAPEKAEDADAAIESSTAVKTKKPAQPKLTFKEGEPIPPQIRDWISTALTALNKPGVKKTMTWDKEMAADLASWQRELGTHLPFEDANQFVTAIFEETMEDAPNEATEAAKARDPMIESSAAASTEKPTRAKLTHREGEPVPPEAQQWIREALAAPGARTGTMWFQAMADGLSRWYGERGPPWIMHWGRNTPGARLPTPSTC